MYNQLIAPMNATVYSTLVFYIGSSAYRSFRMRSLEAGILLVVAIHHDARSCAPWRNAAWVGTRL
jgi:hypothetical protein